MSGKGAIRRKPGPKAGERHSGQFVPGDPRINRAGPKPRTPERLTFEAMIAQATPRAVEVLTAVLDDAAATWREKVGAAQLILEHSVGRPVDRVAIAHLNGGGDCAPEQIPTAVLRRRLERLLGGEHGTVIADQ